MLPTKNIDIPVRKNNNKTSLSLINNEQNTQEFKNTRHFDKNEALILRAQYEDIGKQKRLKLRNEPLYRLITNYTQEKGTTAIICTTIDKQIAQGYRSNVNQLKNLKTKLMSKNTTCAWQALIMATMLLQPNLRAEAFYKLAENASKQIFCEHCKKSSQKKHDDPLANNLGEKI